MAASASGDTNACSHHEPTERAPRARSAGTDARRVVAADAPAARPVPVAATVLLARLRDTAADNVRETDDRDHRPHELGTEAVAAVAVTDHRTGDCHADDREQVDEELARQEERLR